MRSPDQSIECLLDRKEWPGEGDLRPENLGEDNGEGGAESRSLWLLDDLRVRWDSEPPASPVLKLLARRGLSAGVGEATSAAEAGK